MGFDTNISDGVAKMRADTILGDIVRRYQCTKNPLKYAKTNSRYGHFIGIPDSDTQEYFSRSGLGKVWVEEILLHQLVVMEENKVAMAQYLTKYSFEKNQD